ncbi:uncharacterized protein LOC127246006 [Andrographis paniculata]|uniref:uncharacterized protein LOC127246006 n=1 Tax=Andrographis paniculata TaxID=175694 RepID=UPI0021E94FC7|nr:uncharacterized protein LOC127246006 [Andrographis paniculata]
MGNCQAIDNASLVIQHPNGKVDSHYCPVSAGEVMKMNPGHYVALLLTTTMYSTTPAAAAAAAGSGKKNGSSNIPLRITRIKLLRPTDTLALGHVYRLVTYQEVMKGLWAKKQAKLKQQHQIYSAEKHVQIMADITSDFEAAMGKSDAHKTKVKQEKHRSGNHTPGNSAVFKSRAWQPSLKSISEAGS